jgi:GT2 family glycosyltransferase
MAKVSVVIPTMPGREESLKKLLDSIPKGVQTIIVRDTGMSLAAKRNKGALQAKGRYILFIDDDNVLKFGAIDEILKFFDMSTGVMGLVACYDDKPDIVADGGSIRNYTSGFMKGQYTNENLVSIPQLPYEVNEVANAFVMRRQLHRWIGGFDETNFPIDMDEADICKRVKDMGFKIKMCPSAVCYHKSMNYSWIPDFRRPMNAYMMGRNRILFQKKHLKKLPMIIYSVFWFPVFIGFYVASLIYKRNAKMIKPFLKGVRDGIFGGKDNRHFQFG